MKPTDLWWSRDNLVDGETSSNYSLWLGPPVKVELYRLSDLSVSKYQGKFFWQASTITSNILFDWPASDINAKFPALKLRKGQCVRVCLTRARKKIITPAGLSKLNTIANTNP